MTTSHWSLTRSRTVAALLAPILLVVSLASCTESGGIAPTAQDAATTSGAANTSTTSSTVTDDERSESRPTPQLTWSPCNPGLECADMEVPVDYSAPDGDTLTIAMVRRPARDPEDRIGSVVVNPGGPGASGIEAVSWMLMPPSITERFDVVGFDPRGVGASSPLDCHTHLQAIYDADPTMDDAADTEHYLDVSQQFVDECQAKHGDLLPHLGTENVARDLDVIRAALGDDKLTYVGFSYGTSIGQQYARLFPDRVRAMVLDGVVDPTVTGIEAAEDQAAGFTRALDAYIANCDRSSCLGAPATSVIDEVIAASEASPIAAPGADRAATPGVVNLALTQALYSRLLWSQLTRALRDAMEGDGTALVALADSYLQRLPNGRYENGFEIYFAVSCIDSVWPEEFDEVLSSGKEVGARHPRLGEALINDYARCALWPVEPEPLEPIPSDIEGLAPLVFISTTGDPATPYESGVRVAGSVPGARLVTNVGEGHTVFGSGKSCIDDAVARYVVDLTLPETGLRCD